MINTIKCEILWSTLTEHSFNAIAHGKLFKSSNESIVTAGNDGIVRIFSMPIISGHGKDIKLQLTRSLETKCGPALHVLLKDVTRLSPCDMLVADARGAVVLFCDGQILDRRGSVSGKSSRITALKVQELGTGEVNVVVGKDDGGIMSFNSFDQLWKIRLGDYNTHNSRKCTSVTCILPTHVISSGQIGDFIFVSDTNGFLHIIQQGSIRSSIKLPSKITSMASGYFLQPENESENIAQTSDTQIALGCADGSIWICVNFSVDLTAPYANIGYPITHLRSVSQHNLAQKPSVDILVCIGHFSSLQIFRNSEVVNKHELTSWPIAISECIESNGKENNDASKNKHSFLVGCQDSLLHLISISF